MEYQTRRRLLLCGSTTLATFLAVLVLLIVFDAGGVRSFLISSWTKVNSQWDQVRPTEVWTAVNGTATLLVLLVGGAIGYLRFIRRREMHASCSLTLEAKVVPIAAGYAVKVVATVLNAGSFQLIFTKGTQQYVDLISADMVMWDEVLLHGGQMIWTSGSTQIQGLLQTEEARRPPALLEPGQQLQRTLLFPISRDSVAFNIRMYVEACPRWVVTVRNKQD